jgi:hypothetical protein
MASSDDDLFNQLLTQLASSSPGFNNSILAGMGTLIRAMIQSPNYVAGVSGWTINKDGSAEFNNLTIRGTFFGSNFEVNSQGIFFYTSLPPTLGGLLIAIAPAAGVDSAGNSYAQGLTIADPATLLFPSNRPAEQNAALISSAVGNLGLANEFLQLLVSGPSVNTAGARDEVYIEFNSASKDNSSNANMDLIYQGSNGNVHEYAFVDANGLTIQAGSIIAPHPGTTPAVPESWTTIPLINGFGSGTNNGFVDVPQVRQLADNKMLAFKGTLACPASGTQTIWGNMPAGYPNANLGGLFGMIMVCNLSGGTVDHIELHNNGNLGLNNVHTGLNFDISGVMSTQ